MKNKIGSLLALILLALTFKPSVALAYYDPELGRFIQPDTMIPDLSNPQSYNRYSYCLNNPLRYNDPSGHDPTLSLGVANLSVQERIIASRAAAPGVIGVGVAGATAGVATPVLVGAGASAGFAAVGSGVVGGMAGDAAAQGTQIGLGTRSSFSGQEMAVSGLAGGAINGSVAGVSKIVSANTAQSSLLPAKYDPKFAAEQILGGPAETPGGRIITDHAARQMTTPPPGRVPMTAEEIDKVLDTGNKITKINPHPQGTTVTVQQTGMSGKPKVVVDAATGNRVVTVIKNKE